MKSKKENERMICLMRLESCELEEDNGVVECASVEEAKEKLREMFLEELSENLGEHCNKVEYDSYSAYIEYDNGNNVRFVLTDEEGFVKG